MGPNTPTSQLVEVAFRVFSNWNLVKEENEDKRWTTAVWMNGPCPQRETCRPPAKLGPSQCTYCKIEGMLWLSPEREGLSSPPFLSAPSSQRKGLVGPRGSPAGSSKHHPNLPWGALDYFRSKGRASLIFVLIPEPHFRCWQPEGVPLSKREYIIKVSSRKKDTRKSHPGNGQNGAPLTF